MRHPQNVEGKFWIEQHECIARDVYTGGTGGIEAMKKQIFVVIAAAFVITFVNCLPGQKSIVGKWNVVRSYDYQAGKWFVHSEPESMEFQADGSVIHILGTSTGSVRQSYTADQRTDPARKVWMSGTNRTNGIYRFEDGKLLIKWQKSLEPGFPNDFGIDSEHTIDELQPAR